ncbi:MAG: hypothetical protein J6V80_02720 [Clostridia bacterium]|nr:hypothetical protein [Clostridia bacterium]
MKKRIVALILTVVMSLLALTGCGSYDFAKETISDYATFDSEKFNAGLNSIVIKDGKFTTNSETQKLVLEDAIYSAVADKIILQANKDEDKLTTGTLTEGDVLYFVYYAVDENGNMFFGSNINKDTVSSTDVATKNNHFVKLDGYYGYEDEDNANKINEAFISLVAENVRKNLEGINLEDYVYTKLNKTDLENKAIEGLTDEADITAAKEAAVKVANGDTIVIKYTRTYKATVDGVETTYTEKANFDKITLNESDPIYSLFINDKGNAKVGDKVVIPADTTVTINEKVYTYTDLEILWKVEKDVKPLVSFQYTPYTKETKVAPDSVYSVTGTTTNTVDLNNKALTYHIFPVYAIDAPSYEEITAADILYYVNGSSIPSASYDIFKSEDYKNGEETLKSLIADVALIFGTTKDSTTNKLTVDAENKFYKEGTLKQLLDKYNELGGEKPSTEQKAANTEAKTALDDAKNAELKKVVDKIVAAKNSEGKVLGTELLAEYKETTEHSLKESYDTEIVKKVQEKVLELIYACVTVNPEKYPEKLVDEFVNNLYESYEYTYYTDSFDSKTSNLEAYDTFDKFLEATLKVEGADKVYDEILKKAHAEIEPIVKIFAAAKALESDALAKLEGYVQADHDGGMYKFDEELFREYYGKNADKQIKLAKKSQEKAYKTDLKGAQRFVVDDSYMTFYKFNVGFAVYRQQIQTYGETNLRVALQTNNLLYYLTCFEVEFDEEEGHLEKVYDANGKVDFRTIEYSLEASK